MIVYIASSYLWWLLLRVALADGGVIALAWFTLLVAFVRVQSRR